VYGVQVQYLYLYCTYPALVVLPLPRLGLRACTGMVLYKHEVHSVICIKSVRTVHKSPLSLRLCDVQEAAHRPDRLPLTAPLQDPPAG
jgi:hypothetical protein